MLNDAFANVDAAPILLLWPTLAMGVTILAASLLGSAVRDALGTGVPKSSVRRQPTRRAAAPSAAEPMQDRLLTVHDLRVGYRQADGTKTVVSGVNLTVERGEVLGLVGESGSGKTQTAFSVLGLLPNEAEVTADQLSFDGKDLLGLDSNGLNALRGRGIGYIPQEPMSNLDPCFRIGSSLVEPMREHLGVSRTEARVKALALLDRVGISDPERVFRSYPHQISGGMAQRVLIAGAVSCDPQLLIADEPTTALDVTVQAEVLDLMRSLQQERGMAMIIVTHDFGVVADICDRVAVMRTGHIVETAPARQIFTAPEHDYTRMLLGASLEDRPPRGALLAPAPRTEVNS
jgi:peptide/nickel transport system permease protein